MPCSNPLVHGRAWCGTHRGGVFGAMMAEVRNRKASEPRKQQEASADQRQPLTLERQLPRVIILHWSHHRRVGVRRQIALWTNLTREKLWLDGDFGGVPGPLQSARALRLHRPLRGRHAVHRLCARPACARTSAQQRPWREVHRGPASGAARVSGSVPVGGEGAGTRGHGEATYSRAEGRVGRQRETTPSLNQRFQKQL